MTGFGLDHLPYGVFSVDGGPRRVGVRHEDDVLDLFCARATYDRLPEAVAARFGGIADAVGIEFLPGDDAAVRRKVIDGLRGIPGSFREFRTTWEAPAA